MGVPDLSHLDFSAPVETHSFDGLLFDFDGTIVDNVSHIEGRIPRDYGSDAVEIPGARKTLATLGQMGVPWAVVTSGTTALVNGWIDVLNLAQPEYMVVAEDVEKGKPDPACYLLGRRRLGLPFSAEMLVVEDAPSGVKAGKAAGYKVVALATTHTVEQLRDAGADWIVKDMLSLTIEKWDSRGKRVSVGIQDSLTL
ncbi:MAG: hypothetical protein Q9160_003639 [Pyrenula sp. 1 TL-2023]